MLFSDNNNLSNAVALVSGVTLNFGIDLFHQSIRNVAGKAGSWRHVIVRHVYSIVYGALDILLWKGVWDGYGHYAGQGPVQAAISLSAGVIALSCSRTIKTAWSMPVSQNCSYFQYVKHLSYFRMELLLTGQKIIFQRIHFGFHSREITSKGYFPNIFHSF